MTRIEFSNFVLPALLSLAVLSLQMAAAHAHTQTHTDAKSNVQAHSHSQSQSQSQRQSQHVAQIQPKKLCKTHGRATFYNPVHEGVEGGELNRHDERITTVETAIQTGFPVTIAADTEGDFGRLCNRISPDRRCLILVRAPGFDRIYPEYRKAFPRLKKDRFIGMIEDSGSPMAFSYHPSDQAGGHIDIAVERRILGYSAPRGFSRQEWVEISSPCHGSWSKVRKCDFRQFALDPIAFGHSQLHCDINKK